jgi:hypothetical protein
MPRRRALFKPTPVVLSGEPWTVKSVSGIVDENGEECWGVAVFGKSEIHLDPDTRDEGNEREILIHECLHVFFPHVDEEVIKTAAKELDDTLEAMGL